MNGYNIPYDSSGKEPPAIAVGEPNPGEPIPVEPNGGPGGGEPPFCGTPPGSGGGPVIMPAYGEAPLGPIEPLESW